MKKYLITSAAALVLCGLITSCTHELDYEASVQNSVVKKYEDAFVTAFGKPDPNQEWGFGSSTVVASRAMTRVANMPSTPTFRDGNKVGDEIVPPISKPAKPSVYNTVALAKAAGVDVIDARGQELNADHNKTYWINSGTKLWQLDGRDNITVYVDDDMTFNMGFSANRNTLVITEGKKVKLGYINENVTVYLAPRAELEITADITFNNNWDWKNVNKDDVLYLSKSSKLTGNFSMTITNGYKVCNDGGTISTKKLILDNEDSELWNNGTITVTEELFFNNQMSHLYNAPNNKITARTLRLINNEHLLYNDGTVNISGNITMTNNSAEIINNDSLLCAGNFDMTAGGAFHNVGNATVTGTTYIYNTNSRWMNDGHYTTGTFEDQNCEQVFNNCHMTVTGTFHLGQPAASNGHSYFVLNGGDGDTESGAYVKCNEFIYGGNTDLWLGNKSFIEVANEFKNANYNSGYEVHGPASGSYAVIKAASFTQEGTYIKYIGNLFIDTPSHFDTGNIEKESSVQGNCWGDKCPVSIPNTNCNPGYNYEHHDDQPGVIRVICEDLSVTQASDWDFNDVVFDVQLADNNTKVKVTLLAAGGTLPLIVGDMDHEVHELFAAANPDKNISTSSMINTGSTGEKYTFINCKEATFYLDVKSEWFNDAGTGDDALVKAVAKNMPVQVYKLENDTKTWVTMECKKGEPAAKIAVGQDYNWCDERTDIRDEFVSTYGNGHYSNFTLYVKGIIDGKWYKNETITKEQADRY